MGTTTFTENAGATPRSTWTVAITGNNITCVNGPTQASRKITFAQPTSVKVTKANTNTNKKYGIAQITGQLRCNNGARSTSMYYGKGDDSSKMPTIAVGTQYSLPLTNGSPPSFYSYYTEDFFTSANSNIRTIPIYMRIREVWFESDTSSSGSSNESWLENDSLNVDVQMASLTLNAPPTATVDPIRYDKPVVYANYTTAYVDVSDLTAYFGGTITSAVLTIGTQTDAITSDGTLSIALGASGTFTPTVVVTDSRGQTKTYTLPQITVHEYVAPAVNFTVQRTDDSGDPNDEGESAVVTASFDWTSDIAALTAPTVAVTDLDGNAVTVTTTWYSDSGLTTAISDWSVLTANDMPVYGLIDNAGHNAFNPNFSYQIAITPNDTRDSGTTITQILGSAFYTIDFLAGGHGIAFGQPALQPGFVCNMDTTFNENLYIDLPDYQTAGSVDKAIYDAVVALGWDSDVIV